MSLKRLPYLKRILLPRSYAFERRLSAGQNDSVSHETSTSAVIWNNRGRLHCIELDRLLIRWLKLKGENL